MKKKIILGTSDAWSKSRLSHRPSKPAYYIVDWRTLNKSRTFSSFNGCWKSPLVPFQTTCLCFRNNPWKFDQITHGLYGTWITLWRSYIVKPRLPLQHGECLCISSSETTKAWLAPYFDLPHLQLRKPKAIHNCNRLQLAFLMFATCFSDGSNLLFWWSQLATATATLL